MRPRGKTGGGERRIRGRLIGVLLASAALLISAPAAAQALTLSGLSASPASDQGGAHSDVTIHMDFGGGQVKDLTVGLPPGLLGDPNATPLCTVSQLNATSCPANTVVGHVDATAQVSVLGVPLPVPITASGSLFNLTPNAGEPARFGIVLNPLGLPGLSPIILQSAVQLRPDYGLSTVINNIPNKTIANGDTTILSQTITLYGTAPETGKPFMRNPTSCPGPHTTSFTAVPYSGSTATGTASFTTSGCDALDFSPSFSAEVGGPGQTTNGVATTASTAILQDLDEAGLLNAKVTVPPDLNPNATVFFGAPCSQPDFAAGACAPSTIVGLATAASPLLSQPLIGNVELVASGGAFPSLGLDLKGQLHLLLQGATAINPNTVTFNGLPDIPISRFQLTFTPSPGLLGTSRDLCVGAPPMFHADFTGYNGKSTSVDSAATVDGCGAGSGNGGTSGKAKCKKVKKKKHRRHSASAAKKKHKKKSCKKKKRRKKRR
jgi:hypothetical protein